METGSSINTVHTCRNCVNTHTGSYCNKCGEKVITAHDKSIGHIAEEVFHFFTHFDNSFFNSFRTIVASPGKFSHDYCNGSRKKYYKPVSLFFLLIVVYLLFPGAFPGGLNMPLGQYLHRNGMAFTTQMTEAKMARLDIDFDTLAELYQHKSHTVSKLMLLTLLPLSAFALAALHPRKAVYYDNFILATELNSFFLVCAFMIMPFCMALFSSIMQFAGAGKAYNNFDDVAIPLFSSAYLLFCTVSFRRFYGSSWLPAGIKSAAYIFIHLFIWNYIYKALLFLTTMALIRHK